MTLKFKFNDENTALWVAARFRALQDSSHAAWTDTECREFCARFARYSELQEDGADAPASPPGWDAVDTAPEPSLHVTTP